MHSNQTTVFYDWLLAHSKPGDWRVVDADHRLQNIQAKLSDIHANVSDIHAVT